MPIFVCRTGCSRAARGSPELLSDLVTSVMLGSIPNSAGIMTLQVLNFSGAAPGCAMYAI